jgi:hypothetical protein
MQSFQLLKQVKYLPLGFKGLIEDNFCKQRIIFIQCNLERYNGLNMWLGWWNIRRVPVATSRKHERGRPETKWKDNFMMDLSEI